MFKEIKPNTEGEWLDLRTTVLTASDMGGILGLNKYKSVSDIIKNKKESTPFENSYTWLGQALEPVVVKCVNKALGREFKLFERSFFVDTEIGLGATPDAGEGQDLLECKSTKPGNYLRWAYWPPSYYLSQLYTQMVACNRQIGYLGILSTNLTQESDTLVLPLHVHKIVRDEELDDIIISEVKRFWKCQKDNKMYRVNRKQAEYIELKLRINIKRVYG